MCVEDVNKTHAGTFSQQLIALHELAGSTQLPLLNVGYVVGGVKKSEVSSRCEARTKIRTGRGSGGEGRRCT